MKAMIQRSTILNLPRTLAAAATLVLSVAFAPNLLASHGIYKDFVIWSLNGGGNQYFHGGDGTTGVAWSGAALGTFNLVSGNLTLQGAEINTYDGETGTAEFNNCANVDDVYAADFFYCVYKSGTTAPGYTDMPMTWIQRDVDGCDCNEEWDQTAAGVNLLQLAYNSGGGQGTYNVSVFFRDSDSYNCTGTYYDYDNNGGANWTATFVFNPPIISATASSLSALTTTYGTAGTATSFSVSGANMVAGITVTPPAGFEVSQTSSTTGFAGSGNAITVGSSGTISSTTVWVRFAATATVSGTYNSQNIVLSSSDATSVVVTTASSGNTVSKAPLTVTGASVTPHVYDGTENAAITGATLSGVLSGDTGNVTLGNATTGTFAQSTVGTGISVATAMTISGSASGNYSLTQPTLTGSITKAALTVTGASVTPHVYDGTENAAITGATLSGVLSGDTGKVTLGNATTGTFAQSTVGTGISVATAMTISGSASGNYSLTQPTLTGNITAAPTVPVITTGPQSQTVCSGSPATFTVAASGTPPLSYDWYQNANAGWGNGGWIMSGSGSVSLASSTGNDNGASTCHSFGNYGDIDSRSGVSWDITGGGGESVARAFPAALTSGQVFQIDMDNGGVDTLATNGFTLENSGGDLLLSFYFQGGGSDYVYYDGTGANTTAVPNTVNGLQVSVIVGTGSPASYLLLITPCGGSTFEYSGTFANAGAPDQVLLFNNNAESTAAYDLFFNSMFAGFAYDDADNYSGWISGSDGGDTAPIPGATNTSYTTSTAGLYYAIASNSSGFAATTNALLTVSPLPTATVSGSAAICAGGSTTVSAVLTGTGPWTVTWSDGSPPTVYSSSPATYSVSPSSTTTYTVTALSDANCTAQSVDLTGSAVVTVNASPVAPTVTTNAPPTLDLMINIANLLSSWTGSGLSVQSVVTNSAQGGTVSFDATYIYYIPPVNSISSDTISYTVVNGSSCATTASISLTFIPQGGIAQSITLSGGYPTINFAGIPGLGYDVEVSTNLENWTTLETITAPSDGVFSYTDDDPPEGAAAYYRLMQH
jgi:hypothetical protein